MADRNWKTLSLFLESLGFEEVIDGRHGLLHFYNSNTDREITFEKSNNYGILEVELILETINVDYNSYWVFLSSLDRKISP
jgi:hypothetical protein